jgi:hypothetical protein
MNAFCVFKSTRSRSTGFAIRFFQESSIPLQIVRDAFNNLILPLEYDKKLIIEVHNRSIYYSGIIATLGGYNLSQAGSIKASSTFDEGIYEVKPKQTILVNKKYQNILTREGERDLIITENDLGSYLCIYYKSGTPEYYGHQDLMAEPDCVNYAKKAKHLISVKLVARQEIPTNNFVLMAA